MSYLACKTCQQARAEGRFAEAVDCRSCKGKGFYRDPKSYYCNKCAGPLCPNVDSPNAEYPHGLVEAQVVGGYDSPHLTDCVGYRFSLCEECLRGLFATFKVHPDTRHYSVGVIGDEGDESPYAQDLDWYNFVQWRDSGGQKAKLATGLCNYREACQAPAEWREIQSGYLTHEAYCSEHKRGAGNSLLVSVQDVAGIAVDPEDRTREQKLQLANVWLKAKSRGDKVVTHHRYLPDCLQDVTDTDQDKAGGLWYPHSFFDFLETGGAEFDTWARTQLQSLSMLPLADGVLVYGDVERIRQFAHRGLNRGVVGARILDNIPDEEGE